MKLIKEILDNKPSNAIYAMIEGLKEARGWDDFEFDMKTFGGYGYDQDICAGCAATCAVQKIAGKRLNTGNVFHIELRADRLGFNLRDLESFERSIDALSLGFAGNLYTLFEYFELEDDTALLDAAPGLQMGLPELGNSFTDEDLEPYTKLADALKANGY